MKRRDLIRRIENGACVPIRRGAQHDWYQKQGKIEAHSDVCIIVMVTELRERKA